jgi:hypothetical protein
MRWLVAVLVVVPVVLLAAGALTGRARVRCCTACDPRLDTRMRTAFEDPVPGPGHAERERPGGASRDWRGS